MGGRRLDTSGSGYGQVAGYCEHCFTPMFQMCRMSSPAEDQRDSPRLRSTASDQSPMSSIFYPRTVLARDNRRYTSAAEYVAEGPRADFVQPLTTSMVILFSICCISSPQTTLREVLRSNTCPWLTIRRIPYTCPTDISCHVPCPVTWYKVQPAHYLNGPLMFR